MEAMTGGAPGYVEWSACRPLQRYVACSWTSGSPGDGADAPEPVLPDGCIDIIWDGGQLFVAGPDTVPKETGSREEPSVGLRFRPGMAPLFLGVPADELRDQRIDLSAVWPDVNRIAARLVETSTLRQRAAVLEDEISSRLATVREPDRLVERVIHTWQGGPTSANVARLAQVAGISERQLQRRFRTAVGYGPRLLQRVLRFQRFLSACSEPVVGLAGLAFDVGYADQAHLSRETQLLAGRTPAQLRNARLDVRNVQDAPS